MKRKNQARAIAAGELVAKGYTFENHGCQDWSGLNVCVIVKRGDKLLGYVYDGEWEDA